MNKDVKAAEINGRKYWVSWPEDDILVAVVAPEELDQDDSRCVSIIKCIDTNCGVSHSVVMPEMKDEERDMWLGAIQCAAAVMAIEGEADDDASASP